MSDTRETGTIERVFYGKEDHGILTIVVHLKFDGSGQGFGCLAFDTKARAEDFAADLCRVFAVKKLDDLVGKTCEARRCFSYGNIEALVAPSGAMFVITEWRRKHWPDYLDPLEDERHRQKVSIERLRKQIRRAEADLKTLDSRYTPVRP